MPATSELLERQKTEPQETGRRPVSRRKFLWLAGLAGASAIAADSFLLEPNHPRLVRRELVLSRWPAELDGFRIALLSDFHYDPYCSVHPMRAAIPMVNALRPDLIALTGDFVTFPVLAADSRIGAAAAEPCAQLLRQLQAPLGLWAIMGNHDFFTDSDHVTSALRQQGITTLNNDAVPIERNGSRFWLAGVGDVLGGDADLARALRAVQKNEATVLLAHEPDFADYAARNSVDLQLSGHTHGGQIRLPFLRPLYLPELGRKYIAGLYHLGPLTLYTNLGLGTVGVAARWNCPPEVTLITLRSPARSA